MTNLSEQLQAIGRFDLIVIDPPWSYYGQQDKWAAAAKFYPTMSDDEVYALPISCAMSKRSIVFVWATAPRLDAAIRCIERWGLSFRGVAFTWVKTRHDGRPIGAQGVRASITKPTCEYVLAASNVSKGRPIPVADESVASVVLAPRREHSRKPDEVIERIERMYPQASKLEIFARQERAGWKSIGNETSKFNELGSDHAFT